MSPPNDRRVPRYAQQPSIEQQLKEAVEGIAATARHMEQLEDKALSGHYADRAATSRGIGRMPDAPSTGYAEGPVHVETPSRDYGSNIQKAPRNAAPEWTPPHIRVMQAEERVREARCKLEALVDRLCGPQPEDATMQGTASDPIPWGGAAGETANSAARIKEEVDRIGTLLRVLETVVP